MQTSIGTFVDGLGTIFLKIFSTVASCTSGTRRARRYAGVLLVSECQAGAQPGSRAHRWGYVCTAMVQLSISGARTYGVCLPEWRSTKGPTAAKRSCGVRLMSGIRDLAGIGVSPLVRIGHHVKPGLCIERNNTNCFLNTRYAALVNFSLSFFVISNFIYFVWSHVKSPNLEGVFGLTYLMAVT
jgi:hypothetical protein